MPFDAVKNMISDLESNQPDPSNEPSSETITAWRNRIDLLDRIILHLLNERAGCANVIGAIKKKMDMPVYVPSREEEVLRNVLGSNPGPLTNEAVQHLFERIIDETRSLERQKYQEHLKSQDSPFQP